MSNILKRIFGDGNKRQLKRIQSTVDKVNALEDEMTKLSDEELKNKTTEFKNRYKNGETLEDLTSEAYAVVREASKRDMNMRPFVVQIIGGVVMIVGYIPAIIIVEGVTLTSVNIANLLPLDYIVTKLHYKHD